MRPAIPPAGRHHCLSECIRKIYGGSLYFHTSHAKALCKCKVPTSFSDEFLHQFHKAGTATILCAFPTIALPPSGTPTLIEVPNRQKPIQSGGPFCPDITDLRYLLEAVEGHVVCVIGPVMFPHPCFIKFVCEGLPLFRLSRITRNNSSHS